MARPSKGTYNEAKRESKMKILYFAELKELLNRSTETIRLDTTLTVQEFESYLLKRHRELKSKNFKLPLMKNSSDRMIWSNQEIQLRSFHRSVGLIKMKAIILAGGESSRFGKAKAFAKIDNQYFYQKL